jgi:hypothetical protein
MKRLDRNELYHNLSAFLSKKGIEFKDGSYTRRIQKGCSLLTDAINLTQEAAERAKAEMDKKLEQMRQTIHEKTAPKPPQTPPSAEAQTPPSAPPAETPPPAGHSAAPPRSTHKKPARRTKPSRPGRSGRKRAA